MVVANATCMANSVGCIRSIPVTTSGAVIASVTENPDSRAISGSISAMVAANTGSFASRSAPIEAHCEPCPENTHTGPRSSWPTAGWYGASPSATSRRASTSSALSAASTPVRTGRWPRRHASVYARSDAATGSESARPSIQSANVRDVLRSASAEVADSAKQQRAGRLNGDGPVAPRSGLRGLLENGVHVGARHPVRGHRRPPGRGASWSGHGVTCAAQRVRS